jgi:ribosomal protein S1
MNRLLFLTAILALAAVAADVTSTWNEVVKVGRIVKVQVLSADPKTKRIALSMKALQGPQRRGRQSLRPSRNARWRTTWQPWPRAGKYGS